MTTERLLWGDSVSRRPSRSPFLGPGIFNLINSLTPDERQALISANLAFAGWFARRYQGHGVPYNDLRQEARLALCEAAQSFDPANHSANIRTYAGWLIWGRLNKLVEKANKFPTLVDFTEDQPVDPGSELPYPESVIDELLDSVSTLPDPDQEILVRRYGLDGAPKWSVEETELKLGISAFQIRRSISRSFRILNRELREIA
jgi:RNA polymerase sigma factor (sigma-70 family)